MQDAVIDLALRHDSLVGWLFEGGSKLIDVLHLDMDHGPRTTHKREEMPVMKELHQTSALPKGTDSGPKAKRVEKSGQLGWLLSDGPVLASIEMPLPVLPQSFEMNSPQRDTPTQILLTFLVTQLQATHFLCNPSGPQAFWHQGPISWKIVFPWTGGGEGMVSG